MADSTQQGKSVIFPVRFAQVLCEYNRPRTNVERLALRRGNCVNAVCSPARPMKVWPTARSNRPMRRLRVASSRNSPHYSAITRVVHRRTLRRSRQKVENRCVNASGCCRIPTGWSLRRTTTACPTGSRPCVPSLAAGHLRVRTSVGRNLSIVATQIKRRCSLEASIACFNAFNRLKSIRKRDAHPGRNLHAHRPRYCRPQSRLRCRCWRFHSR